MPADLTDADLDDIEAASTLLADAEAFADDGTLYVYAGETCHRVGGAAHYAVADAFMRLAYTAPALLAEVRRLRGRTAAFDSCNRDRRAAEDENDRLRAELAAAILRDGWSPGEPVELLRGAK